MLIRFLSVCGAVCVLMLGLGVGWASPQAHAALLDLYDAEAGVGPQGEALDLAGRSGTIVIDTDNMMISGPITPTRTGEDVDGICVFRFTDVNLGPNVTVEIIGDRPLAITSNNDIYVYTDLTVNPGTLGGAPNGGSGGQGGQGGIAGTGSGGAGGAAGAGGAGGEGRCEGCDEIGRAHV